MDQLEVRVNPNTTNLLDFKSEKDADPFTTSLSHQLLGISHRPEEFTVALSQISWDDISEPSFLLILKALKSTDILDFHTIIIAMCIMQIVIKRDFSTCFRFILDCDLLLDYDSIMNMICTSNAIDCANILLESKRPEIAFDHHMVKCAILGRTRILYMLIPFCSQTTIQASLYEAISFDNVEVVMLLLNFPDTPVIVDQKCLTLAMRRNGKNREYSTKMTVLNILIKQCQEVEYVKYLSDHALQTLRRYCTQYYAT
jgi:hypothetical protein